MAAISSLAFLATRQLVSRSVNCVGGEQDGSIEGLRSLLGSSSALRTAFGGRESTRAYVELHPDVRPGRSERRLGSPGKADDDRGFFARAVEAAILRKLLDR
eukprot:scaffold229067_cov33-Tisochrysis_lutea.AAC.2